jgi:hypothetical protein
VENTATSGPPYKLRNHYYDCKYLPEYLPDPKNVSLLSSPVISQNPLFFLATRVHKGTQRKNDYLNLSSEKLLQGVQKKEDRKMKKMGR